jgi:molybdopterin converting factor small subunit
MNLRILAFASASDALGAAETRLEIAGAGSVGDLRRILVERFPALGPLGARLAIAIDGELVRDDAPLRADAEIALLPPVSGG